MWKIFLASLLLGLLLHWLPNLGIPLHSDVTWMFRLQTASNPSLKDAIPQGLKGLGAYPKNPLSSCRDWYQLTGRYNCVDIISLWLTAKLAGGNAEAWRLIYIVFMSGAVAFWYAAARALAITKPLALSLGLGLFLYPLDVWTDHKTAEPHAIFFLMLSYFLTTYPLLKKEGLGRSPHSSIYDCFSALFMLLSILSKETFITGWLLVPALIYWRQHKMILLKQLLPHALAFIVFIAYVFFMRSQYTVATEGYALSTSAELRAPLFPYYASYLKRILPIFFFGWWKEVTMVLFITLGGMWLLKRAELKKTFSAFRERHTAVMIVALGIAVLLAAMPYYLTSRHISGRFMLPGNFLLALLIGILAAPFFTSLKNTVTSVLASGSQIIRSWYLGAAKSAFVLIVLTLSVKPLDQLLHASAQNRIDQQQWQSLISQLKEIAPRGGYVVLDFDEPYMIETAQSIEANTLLAGRYDLTYHLQFKNNDALAKDPFLASLIKTYLGGQTPVTEGADIFIVQADRKGTTLNVPVPSLPESLSRFLASPRQAFFERYVAGKTPYLNYQIEYQDSPPKKGEI